MIEILKEPYIALFLIMTFGVALSKIRIANISLGSSSIVFVALIFGHYGFEVPVSIENIGLILFIFAVGIQAGPGFFESFRTGEARQYLVTVSVSLILLFLSSIFFSKLLGYDSFFAAGMFSGVSTSSAAFASIVENSKSTLPLLPYTIAYPISLITTILSIRLMIQFMKIDITKEETNYLKETEKIHPKVIAKYYKVSNPSLFEKTLKDLKIFSMTGALVTRVKQLNANESVIPTKDLRLQEDDLIKAIGDDESHRNISYLVGPEVLDKIKISDKEHITSVLVTNINVIGKRLSNLNLTELWDAEIIKIRRAGVDLVPHGTTRLRFGDKVQVSVKKDTSENLIKMLGGLESKSIDFLPMAISIVLGVIIGQITFPLAGSSIGPGISGGILLTTLMLGRLGKTGPLLWSIAGTTNQFLRELGLMFFLCGVGSRTGQNFISAVAKHGIATAFISFIATLFAILVTAYIVLKIQKLNKLRFIGALAGSLTCSAALPQSNEIEGSSIPLTAYSVTYPFALLATIILGQLILFL